MALCVRLGNRRFEACSASGLVGLGPAAGVRGGFPADGWARGVLRRALCRPNRLGWAHAAVTPPSFVFAHKLKLELVRQGEQAESQGLADTRFFGLINKVDYRSTLAVCRSDLSSRVSSSSTARLTPWVAPSATARSGRGWSS